MLHRYSIAIHPSPELIVTIKNMKEQLAIEVGWFNSKNSVAHITICEFEADERDLERVKKQLERICDTITPVPVKLNGFGTFPNGAFFITPDTDSKITLQPIMKSFHNALLVKTEHHS
ncbi:MAG: 2'-5' RNA ligase family protein, partial [Leadbetterella sp.]|nr:2'-5' RNA ligase family protein [Leadbetterella sp.]